MRAANSSCGDSLLLSDTGVHSKRLAPGRPSIRLLQVHCSSLRHLEGSWPRSGWWGVEPLAYIAARRKHYMILLPSSLEWCDISTVQILSGRRFACFEDSSPSRRRTLPTLVASRIRSLSPRRLRGHIPIIITTVCHVVKRSEHRLPPPPVVDHFPIGMWRSDETKLVLACLQEGSSLTLPLVS